MVETKHCLKIGIIPEGGKAVITETQDQNPGRSRQRNMTKVRLVIQNLKASLSLEVGKMPDHKERWLEKLD
jgi:hypothetical protein